MNGGAQASTGPSLTHAMSFAGAVNEIAVRKNDDKKLLTSSAARRLDTVVISEMGNRIHGLYERISGSNDQAAIEGFKAIMLRIGSTTDASRSARFIDNLEEIADKDENALHTLLANIYDLESRGLTADTLVYVDELNMTHEQFGIEGVRSLNAAVRSILDAYYGTSEISIEENLFAFFDTYSGVIHAEPGIVNREGLQATFTRQVAARNDGDAISDYIDGFAAQNGLRGEQ